MKKNNAQQPALHKVIMVGSGGVGKSALTLQFMYDEVCRWLLHYNIKLRDLITIFDTPSYSLLKIMNRPKLIHTVRKSF